MPCRVALIIPDSPFLIEPRTFPMLGPLYLSAALKRADYKVEVLDLTGGGELPDIDADVVGITATTPQFPEAVKLLGEIKARNPAQRVTIGGPHATVLPAECAEAGFDQVVVSEGEQAIIKAINCPYDRFVAWEQIADLDTIAFPDREAIDIDGYLYYLDGSRTTNMVTSRGCPYNCAFCCHAPWGRGVRYRSAKNVLDEARLLKTMGFGGLMFYDDELLMNMERDQEIFIGLGRLGMVYRLFTRANLIDRKRASLLSRTGCVEVLIGCESGSDRILKNINKGTTREMNLKAIEALRQAGVRVKAALIVGLPGESWESVEETASFVEAAEPDDVDFTVLVVFPGCEIYRDPGRYDISFNSSYDPYKTIPGQYKSGVSTSHMSAEGIVQARDMLERRFKPKLWQDVRPLPERASPGVALGG